MIKKILIFLLFLSCGVLLSVDKIQKEKGNECIYKKETFYYHDWDDNAEKSLTMESSYKNDYSNYDLDKAKEEWRQNPSEVNYTKLYNAFVVNGQSKSYIREGESLLPSLIMANRFNVPEACYNIYQNLNYSKEDVKGKLKGFAETYLRMGAEKGDVMCKIELSKIENGK